jgi:hypothetical protein
VSFFPFLFDLIKSCNVFQLHSYLALGATLAEADVAFPLIDHNEIQNKVQPVKETERKKKKEKTTTTPPNNEKRGNERKVANETIATQNVVSVDAGKKNVISNSREHEQLNAKLKHFVLNGVVFSDLSPLEQTALVKELGINIPRITDSKELLDLLQT